MNHLSLSSRIIGYVASLILTLATFFLVFRADLFHLETNTIVTTILIFAIVQAIVQCLCFLHLWDEKGPRWNLILFIFTIIGVVIIIASSIWIMGHLDYNMMPK